MDNESEWNYHIKQGLDNLERITWCNGIPKFRPNHGPIVALVSFVGSGSTFLSHLLQTSTGILTGSKYYDWELAKNGFPVAAICEEYISQVLVVNTHCPDDCTESDRLVNVALTPYMCTGGKGGMVPPY